MTYIENCYNFIKNPLTSLDNWADCHKGIDEAPSNESLKKKMKFYGEPLLSCCHKGGTGFSKISYHHQNMSLNPGKYYETVREGKIPLLQACFDTLVIHPLISLAELVTAVVAWVFMIFVAMIANEEWKAVIFEVPCMIVYRCIEVIPAIGFLAGNKVLELISSLDCYFFSENDDKAQS